MQRAMRKDQDARSFVSFAERPDGSSRVTARPGGGAFLTHGHAMSGELPRGALNQDAADELCATIVEGLSRPQKTLPARYFYDKRGSELFEAITRLPEYYLTRVEIELLTRHAPEIAGTVGAEAIVEFGSGSSTKTAALLSHVRPRSYVPIDISAHFLLAAARELSAANPGLQVAPVAADFTRPLDLSAVVGEQPCLGFFPGSTIGNFTHPDAADLLRTFATLLGPGAFLLIGIDLLKPTAPLEAAYNDAAGITAEFNINMLHRLNREFGSGIKTEAFSHRALWNERLRRIEMHLVAQEVVTFSVCGHRFRVAAGESIHTENSYKYAQDEIDLLARISGWEPQATWWDHEDLFALGLWKAAAERLDP